MTNTVINLDHLGSTVYSEDVIELPWTEDAVKAFEIFQDLYTNHGSVVAYTFKMLLMGVAFPSSTKNGRYNIFSHLGDPLAIDVHTHDVDTVIFLVRQHHGVSALRSRLHAVGDFGNPERIRWARWTYPVTYDLPGAAWWCVSLVA